MRAFVEETLRERKAELSLLGLLALLGVAA